MLPPSASSAMSAAEAKAARTRAVAAKFRMAAHWIPLPSPSPLLLPLPRSSLVQRLVVALMPPPLILSTLPPPERIIIESMTNKHHTTTFFFSSPRPIEAPSPLVHWCLSSHLPLVCRLVVASPVVACLRLASHFVGQPPHASILDPSSLFTPAGCCSRSGVAPPPAPAKHVTRLVHWSQHQQRIAVVTPSVVIVDVFQVPTKSVNA